MEEKTLFTEEELLAIQYELQSLKVKLSGASQLALEAMMEDDERGGDSLDRTLAEQTKSTSLRLKDRELARLREIEAALERIEEGYYGLCELCDEPIGKKRLNANPTSRYCIECQEEVDEEIRRKKYRPGLLDDPERWK